MATILIVGATSDIATAVAWVYARQGFDLLLAARQSDRLADLAAAMMTETGVSVGVRDLDIVDAETHMAFYQSLPTAPQGVVVAVGVLGDHRRAETDFDEARRIIDASFTGIVSFLNIVAADLERRKDGFIVGISSVAGDRGRQSNYIYGAAKAALTTYLSGLRHRLFRSGVHVLTVKPGFVRTRMTAGLDLPSALTASPERVARDIVRAQTRRCNTVYTMWIWRWIMMGVRYLPECLFKRTSL